MGPAGGAACGKERRAAQRKTRVAERHAHRRRVVVELGDPDVPQALTVPIVARRPSGFAQYPVLQTRIRPFQVKGTGAGARPAARPVSLGILRDHFEQGRQIGAKKASACSEEGIGSGPVALPAEAQASFESCWALSIPARTWAAASPSP